MEQVNHYFVNTAEFGAEILLQDADQAVKARKVPRLRA